jgi:hypothetical protein
MNSPRLIWALLLGAAMAPALAQAPAAPAAYDSAFAGYRTYREPQAASWKDTNEQLLKRPSRMGAMGHMAEPGPARPAEAPQAAHPHAGHPHAGHDKGAMPAHPAPAPTHAVPQHGHHQE